MKHGINPEITCSDIANGDDPCWSDLPDEVRAGINPEQPALVELRKAWNKPAPPEIALPTEIYREVIDRRKRYYEVKTRIENGEIQSINDFITYNLNIRQFAQDVTENTGDPDLVRSLYKTLSAMTILDPTCGSGAFLFAALNILEPLYDACLSRMRAFVEDEDRRNKADNKTFSHKYKDLREILAQTQNEHHPNLQYFIYKSIILQNLYGVDIMKEAVEIAKLRLFLKLVAAVEPDYRKPNLGLEPLPDIDFNIRAGNTLVGFATEAELNKGLTWTLDGQLAKPVIEEKCEIVAGAFKRYKEIQLGSGDNYGDFKTAKEELNRRLKELNHELNLLLHKQASGLEYNQWLQSHQPFHWFAEFYEIIQDRKGFNVIIGNPPYVEYSAVRKFYQIKELECLTSGNLYSFVIERSIRIQKDDSYNGMIIPLSAYSTDRMDSFHKVQFENCSFAYLSFYAERPSKLFEGAERNLVISLFRKKTSCKADEIYTTYYYKWNSSFRIFLFENVKITEAKETKIKGVVPKISSIEELSMIKIFRRINKNIGLYLSRSKTSYSLYYRNSGGRYWKIITDFQPNFYLNNKKGISSRESYLHFANNDSLKIAVAILSSTTYYWYYIMHSDARTNNPSDLKQFPINLEYLDNRIKLKLISLSGKLMDDLKFNSIMQSAKYQTGNVEFQQFFPQNSKPIIDEIDTVLAEHYGFTAEELDFIINYDIKYRMGKELGGEGEE